MENLTQFGSYQIIRKIGAGGMADVYEAVRVGLEDFQTRVALKCILPAMTRDERFVKMFINEARLGSQLQHPNIIQIQDFNKVNETYYIAMEYVEGVDLSRIIKRLAARGLSLPPTVVIDLTIQALAGLGYAHDARRMDGSPMNIIHRDVKPSNFLITPGGVVKVGDFGIAKAANTASSHSLTGDQLKGTINYMSPEQIDGVPLTPASDLFSVGAIIFEMLTLRPLFDGPTMSATLIKIAMVNIEADMQLVASRYPGFEPVLRKALSRDPRDRFQIATALVTELHQLRQELGDGLSLRDFLAMHKELFEPYGTQPGEQEEDEGPLSMAITPPYGNERPDIFRTDPSLGPGPFVPSFDLEGDHNGEPIRDFDAVIADDGMGGAGVNFEYYPPSPGFSASSNAPTSAFVHDAAGWGEDLSSAAQRLLDHPDDDETGAFARSMERPAVVEEEADILPPKRRGGLWLALIALIGVVGVAGAWFVGQDPTPDRHEVGASTTGAQPDPSPQSAVTSPMEPARLVLSSTPAGARITIDGRRIDALTPTTLPLPVDQTTVSVVLELDGYKPFRQELTYTPGQQLPLGPTLIPAPTTGTLVVTSMPAGARVYLDQKPTGKQTPATFDGLDARQAHRIALRHPGYQTWVQEVSIEAEGKREVTARLEPGSDQEPVARPAPVQRPTPTHRPTPAPVVQQPRPSTGSGIGTLVLNTTPPEAEAYVDGRMVGLTPLRLPVTAGQHVIEFRSLDGRKRKDISVNVADGENRRLIWDFDEEQWKYK